jgi:hypothetical protein
VTLRGLRHTAPQTLGDPCHMCMKSPKMPDPPPPPQPLKPPDVDMKALARRNRSSGMTGGSLLTGPSGLTGGMPTGRTSLLGG